MFVNWEEVQQALVPLKDYEDLARRFQVSFSYPFVRAAFNLDLPALIGYTHQLLEGDARRRYTAYSAQLVGTLTELRQAGVTDILALVARTQTRQHLPAFCEQSGISALSVAQVLKYLVYWLIPGEKYLSGLIRPDPALSAAIKALGSMGIRTNLDLLQQGLTWERRKALAQAGGLPEEMLHRLVNIADLSRLPWASKATIANIIGAGYGSLSALANANPEKLYADFFSYGQSIGKNLKLGNEIENSYRIARLVPRVVEDRSNP